MSVCFDCGEEFQKKERYCPYCGSPAEVKIPTEADLREPMSDYRPVGSWRRFAVFLFVVVLFVGMIIFIAYISKLISMQTSQIGGVVY
jgi:uncharacterized OB-fold protein